MRTCNRHMPKGGELQTNMSTGSGSSLILGTRFQLHDHFACASTPRPAARLNERSCELVDISENTIHKSKYFKGSYQNPGGHKPIHQSQRRAHTAFVNIARLTSQDISHELFSKLINWHLILGHVFFDLCSGEDPIFDGFVERVFREYDRRKVIVKTGADHTDHHSYNFNT